MKLIVSETGILEKEFTDSELLQFNKDKIENEIAILEQAKQARISVLKMEISNKKLLDMDCVAEQTELKSLLGL